MTNLNYMHKHRQCGDCAACCFVMGVKEIGKPVMSKCQHQAKKGCSIYAERPTPCRVYSCLWREGFGLREHRPDKLGVIFDLVREGVFATNKVVMAREVFAGSSKLQKVRVLLDTFSHSMVVAILPAEGPRRLLGPAGLVKQVVFAAEEALGGLTTESTPSTTS